MVESCDVLVTAEMIEAGVLELEGTEGSVTSDYVVSRVYTAMARIDPARAILATSSSDPSPPVVSGD